MPRRPSTPKTPLGAWLAAWLDQHPDWTHQALADDIGVSKGLISQWASGSVKSIRTPNLEGLSRVTGEPLENLERMVYGARAPRRTAAGEATGIYLTSEELEAMLERAADKAVRRLLDEQAGGHGA